MCVVLTKLINFVFFLNVRNKRLWIGVVSILNINLCKHKNTNK